MSNVYYHASYHAINSDNHLYEGKRGESVTRDAHKERPSETVYTLILCFFFFDASHVPFMFY